MKKLRKTFIFSAFDKTTKETAFQTQFKKQKGYKQILKKITFKFLKVCLSFEDA